MKYNNIYEAKFISRPNRFIANVEINNDIEKIHVKNTGRCKEILIEGTKVYIEKSNNPDRKTKYSLISAYKDDVLINIDSQVPNKVVYDAIIENKIDELKNISILKREKTYGNSRFDLYYENGKDKGFIEVKGVTLELDGISMFPDAPTKRGAKHIYELVDSLKYGYKSYIFFLIQIDNINIFTPNRVTDPDFSDALVYAQGKGVEILAYNSIVTRDSIEIGNKVEIKL